MIFPHLTLLNQHKRAHTQDGTESTSEGITIVTQAQNLVQAQSLVQAQNLVSETGQNLGEFKINIKYNWSWKNYVSIDVYYFVNFYLGSYHYFIATFIKFVLH